MSQYYSESTDNSIEAIEASKAHNIVFDILNWGFFFYLVRPHHH